LSDNTSDNTLFMIFEVIL